MKTWRIERTEIHTRVWIIEAESQDDALETYIDGPAELIADYHCGYPDVRITEEPEPPKTAI